MGTNYYVEAEPPCKECGRGFDEYHIGKSSAGWCFSLHVIPELNIHNLNDWIKFWDGKTIKDEYGRDVSEDEMLDAITNRGRDEKEKPFGYQSWDDFHEQNGSIMGPKNLLRHKLGRSCVGHGDGAYDYISGEFY